MPTLQEVVDQLPPELQDEVLEFAESLLTRPRTGSPRRPRFGWAGALAHLGERLTSVELQHEIAKMRSDFYRTSAGRVPPDQWEGLQ